MFKLFRRLSLTLVFSFVAACGTTPFGEVPTIEAEKILGAKQAPAILKSKGGLYNRATTKRYLQELTDKLVAVADVPAGYLPLEIDVLDTNIPNAYTLVGGSIVVSRGLIALANDEAALAGVIAHEIGHVKARHVAEGIAENEKIIEDIIRQKGTRLRSAGARTAQVRVIRDELEGRLSEITTFSKEAELEADRIAVQILRDTGYGVAPYGALMANVDKLQRRRVQRIGLSNSALAEIELRSGYPKTRERIAALGVRSKQIVDPESQERLMDVIDGLDYDDRYGGGLIRDGAYWNPRLGFAFDVPSAAAPEHGQTLQLITSHGLIDVRIDPAANVSPGDVIKAMSTPKMNIRDARSTEINGFPAAVASAIPKRKRDGVSGKITLVKVKDQIVSFVLLSKTAEIEKARPLYDQIVGSIRPANSGDAPGRRYYKARRVEPGDTVASVAASSRFNFDQEEELRALNGLGADDPLPVDGWVKLVR